MAVWIWQVRSLGTSYLLGMGSSPGGKVPNVDNGIVGTGRLDMGSKETVNFRLSRQLAARELP